MSLLDLVNSQRAKLQRNTSNRPEKISSEKNLIRILPGWNGKEDGAFSQNWGQHFIKDANGALKAVYICTDTNFDEPCPICDELAKGAALTGDEDILKTLKDARSSRRILVNAMYLKGGKHENPEKNPVVLDLPPTVWDSILATFQAFMEEGVNIFSITEGHNFIIEKTGTGMATEYKVTPSPKATKIDPEVMTKVKDLTEWARQESEPEKNKAVTTVRVISGIPTPAYGGAAPARLAGPAARLSEVDADAIDADFTEVTTKPGLDTELDDFLKDL